MHTQPVSLLIVDDDATVVRLLIEAAQVRGYRAVGATSLAQAQAALGTGAFDIALVDLGLGSESGLDVIRLLAERAPETEIVVMSGSTSLAPAIQSFELSAFAFVQKPFDAGQLFATLDRALERRRMNLENRRLVWELQTINEIADGIARSLELNDVLASALQRLVRALDVVGGSIRLRDDVTGQFEEQASSGRARSRRSGATACRGRATARSRRGRRSSSTTSRLGPGRLRRHAAGAERAERADAGRRRAARHVERRADTAAPVPRRGSAAGRDHRRADRRGRAERAAARFGPPRQARVGADLRRDQRSDCGLRRPRRAAARQPALALHLGRRVTELRGSTCAQIGFCDGDRDPTARSRARSRTTAAATRGHAARRPDLQRHDVPDRRGGGRRVGRAGREERHRGDPRPRGGCSR